MTRRKFVRLAMAAGAVGLAVDATLIDPNYPRVVRQGIALARWPERLNGFTIALLSDFHFDSYCSVHPLRAAVGMVNALKPDIIVLTGDFVSVPLLGDPMSRAFEAEPCAQLLKKMRAPHGLWAVIGNHDAYSDTDFVIGQLADAGIKVLENQSAAIEQGGGRFWLSGVGDVIAHGADINATLRPVPASEPTILLAHEPDFADHVAKFPVDLQLSGHSHGGQVRVPLLPAFYLPELAKKYVAGLYKIGSLTLYTNSGIGTVGVPVRFNCPPEITLLTVRQG